MQDGLCPWARARPDGASDPAPGANPPASGAVLLRLSGEVHAGGVPGHRLDADAGLDPVVAGPAGAAGKPLGPRRDDRLQALDAPDAPQGLDEALNPRRAPAQEDALQARVAVHVDVG